MKEVESFNIELLYVFVAVSELKSINKSSKALLITQPALSKKIKQLEDYYGSKLFIRSSQGMKLTPIGTHFYKKAKKFLIEFQNLKSSFSSNRISLNSLRIGTLDSISSNLYPEFFIENLHKFKSITVTSKIFELIDPFNANTLDLVLMDSAFKQNLTGSFIEKNLYEEPYYLVYAKDNEAVNKLNHVAISARQLQRMNLIMYPTYCPIHQRIIQIFDNLHLAPPSIFEVDYSESTISLVSKSSYVTILPQSLATSKVTQDILHLGMIKIEIPFLRQVSIFSRTPDILKTVASLLSSVS
ncbi:LysR family transcriptional regulator [Lactobacillus sp. CBA3605]|uniref:LysR family transcriptional regulator n=1 Tax=Lactobacillus sp. CBA3605 TaxID=2099788 RepID=UPI000CFC1D68|nr:LysR family transcriptional regulator [Lactobacillus sp. CBA3605]AVK61197.1 LysR family transcriptional regulator [Lactobacillus sp. CBA3605]